MTLDKKLTVIKTTYGIGEFPVIQLNYHDGGELPTYIIEKGLIHFDVLDRIRHATDSGYIVEYDWSED